MTGSDKIIKILTKSKINSLFLYKTVIACSNISTVVTWCILNENSLKRFAKKQLLEGTNCEGDTDSTWNNSSKCLNQNESVIINVLYWLFFLTV